MTVPHNDNTFRIDILRIQIKGYSIRSGRGNGFPVAGIKNRVMKLYGGRNTSDQMHQGIRV
jgi:hypothetical protein